MIRSFKHKALKNFFLSGQTKGIRSDHIKKLRQILAILHNATSLQDLESFPSLKCHALSGFRKEEHAVWVNKNWRVTFVFNEGDVYLTDYEDYHDGKTKR